MNHAGDLTCMALLLLLPVGIFIVLRAQHFDQRKSTGKISGWSDSVSERG